MRRIWVGFVLALLATRIAQGQAAPDVPPEPPATIPTPPAPTPAPSPPPAATVPPVVTAPPAEAPKPESQSAAERRTAAERLCEAHDPRCDWAQTFSGLERGSIQRALAARGIEIEPSPWGKVIGRVEIYNEDVFAEDNWLKFFNFIHYTSRDSAVRSELTLHEGEVWDPERVAESARRLRDPLYSSVVALVPVKSKESGKVDLFVVTRDVWSLRFNSNYTYQQGSLTNLTISLSENNFLGHRALLAGGIVMDQGAIAVGPIFIDKNLLGKHLDLRIRVDDIFTRRALAPGDPQGLQDGGGFHSEGKDATITLSRPLWSLASQWGWGASYTYSSAIARQFYGTQLFPYDDPNTPQNDMLPAEYRLDTWSVNANAVRQWGSSIKHQISFGNTVASTRASLLPNFPGDAQQASDFEHDVLPRSERISQVFVGYSLYVPRYRTLRNVATYDLAEDVQIGPNLSVTFAQALKLIGSQSNFERPSLSAGWTIPWCRDGFVSPSVGVSVRIQNGELIDNSGNAVIRAATPLYRYFRVIAQSEIDTRWHDTQNQFYYVGSDSGLRGFRINQFRGDRRLTSTVEARSIPFPLWVLRVGGVAFYELGGAANSLGDMSLHHDAGFGIRVLIPQTSRDLFRFDVAFPLDSTITVLNGVAVNNPAGKPHFIAGFASYF